MPDENKNTVNVTEYGSLDEDLNEAVEETNRLISEELDEIEARKKAEKGKKAEKEQEEDAIGAEAGDNEPNASEEAGGKEKPESIFDEDPKDKKAAEEKALDLAAAENTDTPAETLAKLALSKFRDVRAAVARNINTTFEVLQKFINIHDEDEYQVRLAAAENDKLSPEDLEILLKDPDKRVREAALKNPSLSKERKEREERKHIYDDYRKALAAAGIGVLTEDMTDAELARHVIENVRKSQVPLDVIAGDDLLHISPASYKSPFEELDTKGLVIKINGRIATAEEYYAFVVRHRDTFIAAYRDKYETKVLKEIGWPEERINLLKSVRQEYEISGAMGHASAVTEQKREPEAQPEQEDIPVNPLIATALDQNTPTEKLIELSKDIDPLVRNGVAQNRSINPELLSELAKDPEIRVRESVAKHRNTSQDTFKSLAEDPSALVRIQVASNTHTSSDTLEKLAKDPDADVGYAALSNGELKPDFLKEMAKQAKDGTYLNAIAQNTSTPKDVLAELSTVGRKDVRMDVASNPFLQDDILEKMSEDNSRDVRAAVAGNTSTSPEVLKELINDPEYVVRFAAAGNEMLSRKDLEILLDDPDDRVREAAMNNPSMSKDQKEQGKEGRTEERPETEKETDDQERPIQAEESPVHNSREEIISEAENEPSWAAAEDPFLRGECRSVLDEIKSTLENTGKEGLDEDGITYTYKIKNANGSSQNLMFTYADDRIKYSIGTIEVTENRMLTQFYGLASEKDGLNSLKVIKDEMQLYKAGKEITQAAKDYLNNTRKPLKVSFLDENGKKQEVEFTTKHKENMEKVYKFFFKNKYLQTKMLSEAIRFAKNQTFGAQDKAISRSEI